MSGVPGLGACSCGGTCGGCSPQTRTASLGAYTGHMATAVPGMGAPFNVASLVPPVRIGSAFPAVDYTWDPSQPGVPPSGESSQVGEWFNRHILRPFVEVGPVRYSPGDGYEDYSGIARIFAYLASAFGVATGLWILQRAFFPGARS